jgi:hypothetical protein
MPYALDDDRANRISTYNLLSIAHERPEAPPNNGALKNSDTVNWMGMEFGSENKQ